MPHQHRQQIGTSEAQEVAHPGAHTVPRLQQTGLEEAAVGVLEGGAVDAVPLRQPALGGQVVAGGVAAGEDRLSQPVLQDVDDGLTGQRLHDFPPGAGSCPCATRRGRVSQ